MKILLSSLFTASGLMVLLPTPQVFACSCAARTAKEYFDSADAVFNGKVIASYDPTRARLRSGADPIIWTFAVDGISKGKVAGQQKVISPVFEGSCGVDFRINAWYQVYARRVNNRLETNICSGTRQLNTSPSTGSQPKSSPKSPSRDLTQ